MLKQRSFPEIMEEWSREYLCMFKPLFFAGDIITPKYYNLSGESPLGDKYKDLEIIRISNKDYEVRSVSYPEVKALVPTHLLDDKYRLLVRTAMSKVLYE